MVIAIFIGEEISIQLTDPGCKQNEAEKTRRHFTKVIVSTGVLHIKTVLTIEIRYIFKHG